MYLGLSKKWRPNLRNGGSPGNEFSTMIFWGTQFSDTLWLVVDLPLWKIWVISLLGWWHSQYMEKMIISLVWTNISLLGWLFQTTNQLSICSCCDVWHVSTKVWTWFLDPILRLGHGEDSENTTWHSCYYNKYRYIHIHTYKNISVSIYIYVYIYIIQYIL